MSATRFVAIATIGLLGTAWPVAARQHRSTPTNDWPGTVERHLAANATAEGPAARPWPAGRADAVFAQRTRSNAARAQAQPRQRRPDPSTSSTGAPQGQGRAVPRESRPRGDNPPTGRATPRDQGPPPSARPPSHGPSHGTSYAPSYRPYYRPYAYRPYSPWYYSPYFYGAFGFSYFYWDPSWYGWPGYGPGYGYGSPSYYGDVGSVRLKMKPRDAQVFVDGYFVGVVDEFDGTFQRLRLPAGPHRIEVRAPGFEPAVFEVYVRPDQTITFERVLQPMP